MPDAAGINEFDYRPPAPGPEATDCGGAREVSRTAEAAPATQDPPDDPKGAN
jgi:hypothetical protein